MRTEASLMQFNANFMQTRITQLLDSFGLAVYVAYVDEDEREEGLDEYSLSEKFSCKGFYLAPSFTNDPSGRLKAVEYLTDLREGFESNVSVGAKGGTGASSTTTDSAGKSFWDNSVGYLAEKSVALGKRLHHAINSWLKTPEPHVGEASLAELLEDDSERFSASAPALEKITRSVLNLRDRYSRLTEDQRRAAIKRINLSLAIEQKEYFSRIFLRRRVFGREREIGRSLRSDVQRRGERDSNRLGSKVGIGEKRGRRADRKLGIPHEGRDRGRRLRISPQEDFSEPPRAMDRTKSGAGVPRIRLRFASQGTLESSRFRSRRVEENRGDREKPVLVLPVRRFERVRHVP